MINNFVFYIIISLVIISLLHYLYTYFINILTVPKIKDLVNKPGQEYKNIEKIILNNKETIINNNLSNNVLSGSDDTTDINNLKNITPETKNDMKNELKNFFNELSTNNISDINSNNSDTSRIQNNLSYSTY
jgi:hypothetical protein